MTAPYTSEEMHDDVLAWHNADAGQMAAAFFDLLAASAAVARTDQNRVLIETIREIRVWVQS